MCFLFFSFLYTRTISCEIIHYLIVKTTTVFNVTLFYELELLGSMEHPTKQRLSLTDAVSKSAVCLFQNAGVNQSDNKMTVTPNRAHRLLF